LSPKIGCLSLLLWTNAKLTATVKLVPLRFDVAGVIAALDGLETVLTSTPSETVSAPLPRVASLFWNPWSSHVVDCGRYWDEYRNNVSSQKSTNGARGGGNGGDGGGL
jgi:hypothetical protein